MDRRKFLRGVTIVAGLAAAGTTVRTAFAADNIVPAGNENHVAVIGAGIVGASIAYKLSKRGCDVVLLDKHGPAAQAYRSICYLTTESNASDHVFPDPLSRGVGARL